jgi:hypothetical protein
LGQVRFTPESGQTADLAAGLHRADFVEKVVDDLWEQ